MKRSNSNSLKSSIKPSNHTKQFKISRSVGKIQFRQSTLRQTIRQTFKTTKKKQEQTYVQKIQKYIEKRQDVEIIVHYQQYKDQFFKKCKNLQDYLSSRPQIRKKYLSESNSHFFKGFQQIMLDLYRKKIIVPDSFNNLREQAVVQIQKWVLSWIQRKLLYEKVKEQERESVILTCSALQQLQNFNNQCSVQELPF